MIMYETGNNAGLLAWPNEYGDHISHKWYNDNNNKQIRHKIKVAIQN